jgi:methylmalonyl-CoA mutase N-terminal domain/subunit
VEQEKVRGTVQNDLLKEYLARGTYIYPPRPSIRLIGDTIEYCLNRAPKFNAVNVAASHMRSAGATYIQATAYMFLNAMEYIKEVLGRGYRIDDLAGNISFLSGANSDFFETVARLRASRRLWARLMKERFEAQEPKSMMFRVATGGDCLVMTVEQPLINVARITLQALSNVLGGTQSMLLPAYDEAYAIPTEESARVSLRIQQILSNEVGVTNVVDPFAGSYFMESLTSRVEDEITAVMDKIEEGGGIISAIEDGSIQREMARQAREMQKEIDEGERPMVGHNCYTVEEKIEEYEEDTFTLNPEVQDRQIHRLRALRSSRDESLVKEKLDALRKAAAGSENTMPHTIEAVKAYATVGEITSVLKEVFGEYHQPSIM